MTFPFPNYSVKITRLTNPILPLQLGKAYILENQHTFLYHINISTPVYILDSIGQHILRTQRCSLEINQHKFYPSDRIDHETIFPLPAISLTNFTKQNLVDVTKFNLKTIQNLQISQEQINEDSIQFPDRPIEKTNLIIFLLLLSTFIGYINYQILKKLREARRRREEEAVPDSQTLDPPFAHLRQGGEDFGEGR
ncbi:unnamed protein product [Acanthoscelides obtectus]|uniref:Uncharacterized protein n=1 Tax=Acanthoscelides obtectus TaxID=200917 RepID=A0A9P0K9T5_ACAOB|nr:unnamed protein product [Acanthoscelides obtectus]CAK1660855.1 hypothetical protein AOBTE_LOCUS22298 [Acanthoscelides obtectus]